MRGSTMRDMFESAIFDQMPSTCLRKTRNGLLTVAAKFMLLYFPRVEAKIQHATGNRYLYEQLMSHTNIYNIKFLLIFNVSKSLLFFTSLGKPATAMKR